jgi:hypothetical protein
MTAKMNHYIACRAEAEVCHEKSETDVKRRDYWLAEAQKWEKCAEDSDDISVSYQIKDVRLVCQGQTKHRQMTPPQSFRRAVSKCLSGMMHHGSSYRRITRASNNA